MAGTRSHHEHQVPENRSGERSHPTTRILAEGDSWFDLPLKSDIIQQLRRRRGLDITTFAHYGNTMQQMVRSPGSSALFHELRRNEYDLLLFSGGGNDVLSDGSLRTFLRPRRAGAAPGDLLDMAALERRLAQIERLYENLVESVARLSANRSIQVIAHTYDFVWPRHAPYCVPAALLASFAIPVHASGNASVPVRGPWLEPIMRQRGVIEPQEQHEIVKLMLRAFRGLLERVAARTAGRLVIVDTQGTLGPGHWSDEIHPDATGAHLLASKIYELGIQPRLARGPGTSR